MKYNYQKIGDRIRKKRKELHYNQDEFLETLKEKGIRISSNTLSKIESGILPPEKFSISLLTAMCELFNCETGCLLGEYDTNTKNEQIIVDELRLSTKSINYLKNNANKSITVLEELDKKFDLPSSNYECIPQEQYIYTLNFIIENYPDIIAAIGRILLQKELNLTPAGCRYDVVFENETPPAWMFDSIHTKEYILKLAIQLMYICENGQMPTTLDIHLDDMYDFANNYLSQKLKYLEHENESLTLDNKFVNVKPYALTDAQLYVIL